ncbi:MAG: 5' nucleotidase, NT5C type, partial [Steroidobacteraceae bacterium]
SLFDTYILSTAPWDNPSAWSDKLLWVKKHLGNHAYKRLMLSHHKNLHLGDYLVDDRTRNGADKFTGEHIHFGSASFPDWLTVLAYLESRS